MAAALAALGNDCRCAVLFHHPGHAGGRNHGDDLNAGCQPGFHIAAGVACAGGNHGDLLLYHNLGGLLHKGAHEHDIHAKGLVRHFTALADFFPELLAVGIHGGNEP